jgi:hypothetical protein
MIKYQVHARQLFKVEKSIWLSLGGVSPRWPIGLTY